MSPVIVAHISGLVAKRDRAGADEADELLSLLPEPHHSTLGAVAGYLRFVNSLPADLSDEKFFSSLSPEDLYLGACYYGKDKVASQALANLSKWDYESLTSALSVNGNHRSLNNFKVRGLQPRIAELAFPVVYSMLHDADASILCDWAFAK